MGAGMQSHYTLRPSRNYLWLLSFLCVLLLFAIFRLPCALEWCFTGGLLVVTSFLFVGLRDVRLRLSKSCVAFRLESENGITLIQRNGQHMTGTIGAGGVVTPLLVLLNVKQDGGQRRSLVLLTDSMNRDAFRRFRIALRWNR